MGSRQQEKARRRKKLMWSGLAIVAGVLIVLFALADRYLIEHVEQLVEPPAGAGQSATPGLQSGLAESGGEAAAESAVDGGGEKPEASGGVEGVEGAEGTKDAEITEGAEVAYDDWNYTSAVLQISIQQVQTGAGADMITYYVADVVVSDTSHLLSAFAKNAFGRNILENTSTIAANNSAIFAINGDYYGFREDGVVIRNGILYRDEPARTGLAIFRDGTLAAYDEEAVSSSDLLAQDIAHTFSFGPALLVDGKAITDFGKVKIDTNFGNRSIAGSNPRTAVGMIAPNHYVFIVVDGRKANYSRGMTLEELAAVFEQLGCTQAYNLDGGGSSTMVFMGRVVNNPQGRNKERGVSDILYVAEN